MKGILITLACAVPALVLAAAGCYCMYLEYGTAHMLVYLLVCLLFFPVASVLHELGHLAFGAACGMRVKLNKASLFGPSSCAVMPKHPRNVRARFIATVLGGIIVNFAFAAAGMGLLFADGAALYFSFVAPASFYLFMLNAVPAIFAGGDTDMLLAVQAAKGTDAWQVLCRVLEIQGAVAEGTPLASVAEESLFSVPQVAECEPAFIMLVSLRADYYAAKGDGENAAKWSSRLQYLLQEYMPESVSRG